MRKGQYIKLMSALLVFMLAFSLNININTGINGTSPSSNKHFIQVGLKKVRADYSGEPDQLKDEYVYKYFKQSGTFIVPSGITKVDVTVVGGGGGGGTKYPGYSTHINGGDGGGGGYVNSYYDIEVNELSVLNILVGSGGGGGGALGYRDYTSEKYGELPTNGEESSIRLDGTIIALADGGKAGGKDKTRGLGGSGGGYGAYAGQTSKEKAGDGGADGSGGGYVGNLEVMNNGQGTTTRGIDGILYAGGGGGGGARWNDNIGSYAIGGAGGGGNGSNSRVTTALSGVPNTGGGGGGAYVDDYYCESSGGGNGGSGIVIIRYLANQSPTITLDSPTSNSPLGASGEFVLSGTIKDEDNDTVTISATINGKKKSTTISATSSTKNWSLKWQGSELSEGTYTNITVTADDGSGGKDTKTYTGTLTVDKTAPIKTNNATINISTNSIKITPHINYDIAGSHATSIKYSWYDKTTSSWIEGNWTSDASFELTELNPNEQYQIRYKARDIVGNESNWLETIERYTLTKIPILELLKATQSTIEGILKY